MTTYKVADLSGALLDAAVAKAEGYELDEDGDNRTIRENGGAPSAWHPSTDWSHGGPIIQRERISLQGYEGGGWCADVRCEFTCGEPGESAGNGSGPTPLIAAMRAYVSSVFGDMIEL
jgi:hypothetical protein